MTTPVSERARKSDALLSNLKAAAIELKKHYASSSKERADLMIAAADRIRELESALAALTASPPAVAEQGEGRRRGQEEGFAAAVSWLRERSAMKPPHSLWHAAEQLADQMEQSRRPAAPKGEGGGW